MSPPTSVTFDFNDGDMTTTVEVARGAVSRRDGHPSPSAWGVARIELTTATPIHPDFLAESGAHWREQEGRRHASEAEAIAYRDQVAAKITEALERLRDAVSAPVERRDP